MPADMQKLMQNKEAIINSLQKNGPSLPIQIARESGLSLLFASAYLSELYNEKKVKMSNMKVGSSSIYYLQGQEASLEKFIQYLNNKEKEALSLLKNQGILDDEKVEPAIRVALRAIKDFAVPVRIKADNEAKLFWKHFLVTDDEIKSLASHLVLRKEKKKKETEESGGQITLAKNHAESIIPKQDIKLEKTKTEQKDIKKEELEQLKQKIDKIAQELNSSTAIEKAKKEKKARQAEESRFVRGIKEYLTAKDIELLSVIEEKKKELTAKIRLDTLFGKQEMLLIAKEKKKIAEEDITIALHKAQLEKMPAFLLAPGDIDKKAQEHARLWRNLVKFEKVKF